MKMLSARACAVSQARSSRKRALAALNSAE
jgi:hypothetical protein